METRQLPLGNFNIFLIHIFTFEDILSRAGIIINSEREEDEISLEKEIDKTTKPESISDFSTEKLQELLTSSIEEEDYEKASKIRDELNKRKGK